MLSMASPQLRVYFGEETEAPPKAAENTVTVTLGEILPLLADAQASRRTWLRDFSNDAVTISADLLEVLLAYQHHRRPPA
jgi:hypothetical protein